MTTNSPAWIPGDAESAFSAMLLQCVGNHCGEGGAVLNQLLNAIADPVFVKDSRHRWQFLNQAYCRLVGYSAAELLGKSEADIFPPAQAQRCLQVDAAVLTQRQPQEYEATITDAAGVEHVVLTKVAPFHNVQGETVLVGTIRDITERKRAEHTLQRQSERERLLGTLAQHLLRSMDPNQLLRTTVTEVQRFLATDWVLFYSFVPDCQAVAASPMPAPASAAVDGLLAVLGLGPEYQTAYRRGDLQLWSNLAEAALPAPLPAQLAASGIGACLVMPVVQGDTLFGLVCVLHGQAPRLWDSWEIDTLREVAAQVGSAIKQARLYNQVQQLNTALEREVAQHTTQLRTALEFEATLKRITDRVRDSLDVNQIMLTAVQELAEALDTKGANTALYDLEQGTSTIYYEHNSSLPSDQGRVAQMEAFPEVYHQLLDGQYFQFCSMEPNPVRGHVAMLACPIVDDRGVLGDLWLINDKTYGFEDIEIRLAQQVTNQCAIAIRQARLYEAAQSQVKELERLNHLKDDFLSTVSHELRTPVTSMRVALQLLGNTLDQAFAIADEAQRPKADQSRISRYFNILQEECEREISLINDLLDLQRLDVGNHPLQLEALTLETWLPTLVESFIPRARHRDQHLDLAVAATLPLLNTDVASLERVLAELLNNACKYTPPGEHIQLSVCALGDDTPQVCFQLVNTGVEIPHAELSRIFDKFYRVPSADPWKQGGTGLGLALVKKLVTYLGGDLSVESEGQRTCFTVVLPCEIGQCALN